MLGRYCIMNIKLGHQYTCEYASNMLGQVDKSWTMNMNLFQELMILVSGIAHSGKL